MLSIVIPVYNEQATLKQLVESVVAVTLPVDREIILVDDCSSDGTADIVSGLTATMDGLTATRHEHNRGKGAALRTGFGEACGRFVIVQDADLEYDCNEYPKLLAPLLDDRADVVYGSRYSGNEIRVDSFWHYLGNKCLTTFSNILSNLHLTDMETGCKMIEPRSSRI